VARTGLRPITWAIIASVILGAATLVLIFNAALDNLGHVCEVCKTFRGRTECREAAGRTAEEATRTAGDTACALLGARGMTLSIECGNTPPTSVTCRENGN
jgi:hypothetical protein